MVVALGALTCAGTAAASPRDAGVQVALRALGLYLGPIDGRVGPETTAAIRAAQQRFHLPVNGALTTRTRTSLGPLGRPLPGTRAVRAGDFGLDVSVVQYLLSRHGAYRGALDGYVGRETEAAVRRYQRRASLSVDGIVGPATLSALERAPTAPPEPSPVTGMYVVQPGDSLAAIASRYGLTLTRLATINRRDPAQVLLVGTHLAIPAKLVERTALTAGAIDVRERLDSWASRLGVSVSLVRALSWMESGYQPGVVSSVGARGVLQLLPMTRAFAADVLAAHPIPPTLDGDIEAGVLVLRHLLDQFGGDERLALAAWYQGEAAVKKYGIYKVTKPFVADVLALAARM